ncbi:TPA: DUF551 domain-containing protein [Serratia marcescens]
MKDKTMDELVQEAKDRASADIYQRENGCIPTQCWSKEAEMKEAWAKQLAALTVPQAWVACGERMPAINQRVIYYFEPCGVHSGKYEGSGTFVSSTGIGWLTDDVTHWMPLPTPPKPEK